jgi:ABC-type transporter Mla maintaining outer membrane lipid asymmetry permease subunit MlaE
MRRIVMPAVVAAVFAVALLIVIQNAIVMAGRWLP